MLLWNGPHERPSIARANKAWARTDRPDRRTGKHVEENMESSLRIRRRWALSPWIICSQLRMGKKLAGKGDCGEEYKLTHEQ